MNKSKYIIWLTGASGVGKTTLLSNLKNKYSNKSNWEFLNFDTIGGVPSNEDMVKEYGSIENWQRSKTYKWIEKMINGYPDKELIIMDSQASLEFIKTGFEKQNFNNYEIILVDCEQDTMIKRLVDERQQAWLASEDMNNWLKFLRQQARKLNVKIIDTSNATASQVVEKFEQILKNSHAV